ncbi:MAG: ABC transporter substrate-binding protein [Chloroflexota bacterium]
MRPFVGSRLARRVALILATVGLLAAGLAVPVRAADPLVLKIGTTQDLEALNPFNAYQYIGDEIYWINYDFLVGFGGDNEPIPGFAESWSQSADGKTWTFKIRPGMKWSDGTPATAEDAAWTFQMIIDAVKGGNSVGYGYIDPDVKNAAMVSATATDPETLVIELARPNDRVLSTTVPILPKHIWGSKSLTEINDFANDPPIVGTGPYQVTEWKTGQYARLERNPNYWGSRGAADEVYFQFFPDAVDTMVQSFKAGELDYIRNPSALQFAQLEGLPGITTISSTSNGFTELGFNTYLGDIPGGGASTTALRDPAFRDALGYAIDKQVLVEKIIQGYGVVGTTQVPPWERRFHVDPTDVRTFDIELAKQKLDAAGYKLDSSGVRLDKDGKALNLRLYFPNSSDDYPKIAQFITDWFGQLGIKVKSQSFDSGALTDILLPPEAGAKYTADYDMFIWGWGGYPDPNSLLEIFTTGAIGSMSDSQFSDPEYDALYQKQLEAATIEERKGYIAQMQQIFYDQAPYHVLYYDNELHAYRTDKFANWKTQPLDGGTPFFVNGSLDYTLLTDAKATPTPAPSPSAAPSAAASAGASAAPSVAPSVAPSATPAPGGGGDSGGSNTLLLAAGGVALVAIIAVGLVIWRRSRAVAGRGEED